MPVLNSDIKVAFLRLAFQTS